MSTNTVCSSRTVQFDSPAGPVGTILMDLDAADPDMAHAFVRQAAEKFKLQRLSSPLRTETLLVTITGNLSAERFSREWRAVALEDPTLALMMSQLRRADVAQSPDGQSSPATASLLPLAAPEFLEPALSSRPQATAVAQPGPRSTFRPLLARSVPA